MICKWLIAFNYKKLIKDTKFKKCQKNHSIGNPLIKWICKAQFMIAFYQSNKSGPNKK